MALPKSYRPPGAVCFNCENYNEHGGGNCSLAKETTYTYARDGETVTTDREPMDYQEFNPDPGETCGKWEDNR